MSERAKCETVIIGDEPIFALDIGTRSVIGVVGRPKGDLFHILDCEMILHSSRAMMDGQIEDIDQVTMVVLEVKRRLESRLGLELRNVCVAAAGRALKTRKAAFEMSLEPREIISPERILKLESGAVESAYQGLLEAGRESQVDFFCVGYSVVRYSLDGYPIKTLLNHRGKTAWVEVIATFLPEEVVSSLYAVMNKSNLQVVSLTLEPIAAMNAVIPNEIRLLNLALVDIGAGTSDIALCDNGSVSAYTMVTVAGDEITEAVVKHYLVDFLTAETIKLSLADPKSLIHYQDILGNIYETLAADILEKIKPDIRHLSEVICDEILAANGKTPMAVFLAGGGSQIPYLCDYIAEQLSLEPSKVAIGGNNFLKRITCGEELDLSGPEFATPFGIGITAAQNQGQNAFIVELNGCRKVLFKKINMNVLDVLLMTGYNHQQIMGRMGQSITVQVNGRNKVIRGSYAEPAVIYLNNAAACLNTPVSSGDALLVQPAVDGSDAICTIADLRDKMEPMDPGMIFYVNGKAQQDNYQIRNGDEIRSVLSPLSEATAIIPAAQKDSHETMPFSVMINGSPIELAPSREGASFLFVDLFNYVDIDPSKPQGNIVLRLNGHEASFLEPVAAGDRIDIFWDKTS